MDLDLNREFLREEIKVALSIYEWIISLSKMSRVLPCCSMVQNFGWVCIELYACNHCSIFPFIHSLIFTLFPSNRSVCTCYCMYCCYELGVHYLFTIPLSIILEVYWKEFAGLKGNSVFVFKQTSLYFL